MPVWKKLRDDDGDEIWVNLANVIWLQRGDEYTRIAFAGTEDEVIDVVETPEQIIGG